MKNVKLICILCLTLVTAISCKKSKIDNNLNGTWQLSELIIDGYNEVTTNTSIQLEFSNVEKGEGNVTMIAKDAQGTYYTLGTLEIDEKYETMKATFVEPGWTTYYDGDFTVNKSSFEFNGTYSDSSGDVLAMRMKGTK
jgi:hypothetical protein